jgi:hypothetical protein
MAIPIAEIACGTYTAGHAMYPSAIMHTEDRPGIDGTVRWADTAIFTADDGTEFKLYNHRQEVLRSLVEKTAKATLLEINHFLWVELVPELGSSPDGRSRRAVINVAFEPVGPCTATVPDDCRDSDGRIVLIEGGN